MTDRAPGPAGVDEYGTTVYQRSNLVISDGVMVTVRNGSAIRNAEGETAPFSADVKHIVASALLVTA